MKSKKTIASLLALSLIASVAFVGCGKKENDKIDDKNQENKGEAKLDDDQYLNLILTSEPKTLDLSKATDANSSQVLAQCQEALTRIIQDESGKDKIEPGAAEKWETSDDGLVWTFHLRDMKWSDGQPVTADQFVYSIQRTLDPNTASEYGSLLYPIKNAKAFNTKKAKAEDVGIKAKDDKTLEITLEQTCPYFLNLTYFKLMQPQRKDIIEKFGDKYGSEADTMVFCGPFIMKEWVHQNKVEFAKNDQYWDKDKVKLEKATFKIIKEPTAVMNELANGSLDMAGVRDPNWITKLDETKNFTVYKGYEGATAYTMFNTTDKLFSNAKVRKAFLIAEDREGTVKTLRKGIGEVAYAWCPPAIQMDGKDYREVVNYRPIEDLIKENPDPKKLLSEGLTELGMDPDPSKLTVKQLQSGTDSETRTWAEFAQQNYQEALGIKMEMEYVEWPIYQKRTESLDYQMGGAAWIGDYNDPNTFFDCFLSDAGLIDAGWKSEKYDKIIEEANKELEPAKRAEKFKEAEKMLIYDEAVISPNTFRVKNTYKRKYVKNLYTPTFGPKIDLKYAYTEGR